MEVRSETHQHSIQLESRHLIADAFNSVWRRNPHNLSEMFKGGALFGRQGREIVINRSGLGGHL